MRNLKPVLKRKPIITIDSLMQRIWSSHIAGLSVMSTFEVLPNHKSKVNLVMYIHLASCISTLIVSQQDDRSYNITFGL